MLPAPWRPGCVCFLWPGCLFACKSLGAAETWVLTLWQVKTTHSWRRGGGGVAGAERSGHEPQTAILCRPLSKFVMLRWREGKGRTGEGSPRLQSGKGRITFSRTLNAQDTQHTLIMQAVHRQTLCKHLCEGRDLSFTLVRCVSETLRFKIVYLLPVTNSRVLTKPLLLLTMLTLQLSVSVYIIVSFFIETHAQHLYYF